jgi:multimeric flavodoxin WrbA
MSGTNDLHPIKKENDMKVLALNSSPRGDGESKTAIMLNSLVAGMLDAGEVEVAALKKKKIKPSKVMWRC